MQTEEIKETSEYGKMPFWQWIVVYLLIGVIIYGLYYSFVMVKRNNVYTDPQETSDKEMLLEEELGEGTPDEVNAEIELTEEGFVPELVTVSVGTTVVWTNVGIGVASVNSDEHPTHEIYPSLNLGEFMPGESVSLTFDTIGTYKYHNHLNPSQVGTIEVVEIGNLEVEEEQPSDEEPIEESLVEEPQI